MTEISGSKEDEKNIILWANKNILTFGRILSKGKSNFMILLLLNKSQYNEKNHFLIQWHRVYKKSSIHRDLIWFKFCFSWTWFYLSVISKEVE